MKLSVSTPVAVGDLAFDDDHKAGPPPSHRGDLVWERKLALESLRTARTEATRQRASRRLARVQDAIRCHDRKAVA